MFSGKIITCMSSKLSIGHIGRHTCTLQKVLQLSRRKVDLGSKLHVTQLSHFDILVETQYNCVACRKMTKSHTTEQPIF